MQRYRLLSDDDDHWFICPVEREKEGRECIEALERFWEEEAHTEEELEEPPELPDFLIAIDNPFTLTFTDPKDGNHP